MLTCCHLFGDKVSILLKHLIFNKEACDLLCGVALVVGNVSLVTAGIICYPNDDLAYMNIVKLKSLIVKCLISILVSSHSAQKSTLMMTMDQYLR